MLDTTRSIETPEGVELQLHVAGPVVRACAWTVDVLIRTLIYASVSIALGIFGKLGLAVVLIMVFLLEWFYPVYFEVRTGYTPGKKIFNLLVCQDNGTPVSWQASVIRNLLRIADFLPFCYGFGLTSMLFSRDFKRLGDRAAGTLVVYQHDEARDYSIPDRRALALPQPLQLTEQRAILDFAERSSQLSGDRVKELAEILAEYTGKRGKRAVDTLFGYANWLQKGDDS